MLLILTSKHDLAVDYVITELLDRGLRYFRLNAEDLSSCKFTFSTNGEGIVRRLSTRSRTIDLDAVTAVWYRRAMHPVPDPTLSPPERRFITGELRHLVFGLVFDPCIIWVNPIDKVSVAEHKLYQLQIASSLGLQVPRTLVSADIEELRSFALSNSNGTIVKPIFHGLFFDGVSRHSIYTRRVDADSLDADSLRPCPILLQEEIPRVADVRVTFIGSDCFVADIRGNNSLIDWRDPNVAVNYEISSLDDGTKALCRGMLAEMGLAYGAFDFIRMPNGTLIFLELNPTGEWAWLEETLHFPMRDAFIRLFFGERT